MTTSDIIFGIKLDIATLFVERLKLNIDIIQNVFVHLQYVMKKVLNFE